MQSNKNVDFYSPLKKSCFLYKNLQYKHFTPVFLMQNSLCEFTTQEQKFKKGIKKSVLLFFYSSYNAWFLSPFLSLNLQYIMVSTILNCRINDFQIATFKGIKMRYGFEANYLLSKDSSFPNSYFTVYYITF